MHLEYIETNLGCSKFEKNRILKVRKN
jgi:hypothetical protein